MLVIDMLEHGVCPCPVLCFNIAAARCQVVCQRNKEYVYAIAFGVPEKTVNCSAGWQLIMCQLEGAQVLLNQHFCHKPFFIAESQPFKYFYSHISSQRGM